MEAFIVLVGTTLGLALYKFYLFLYSELDSISVYPNPTQNIITIVSPKTVVTSATIYDIRGRKVSQVSFKNQTTCQIDFSTLESALYFFEITSEEGTVTKRILKE